MLVADEPEYSVIRVQADDTNQQVLDSCGVAVLPAWRFLHPHSNHVLAYSYLSRSSPRGLAVEALEMRVRRHFWRVTTHGYAQRRSSLMTVRRKLTMPAQRKEA
ncbi:hypothetical protein [Caballeronia choica]|uniref:hypothetical protein n=1 Tax=Caballeronia choica TaxID=326476 RepID=UPI000F748FCB|nr:hypothetical protein [Caballeronia choica]